ncbi:2-amino-4-hydroxy-6-hydroxymethyldihydropteridine diphosphokinase [Desulfoferrobacter suflitae]|uniref:2-amino-4-hydroxy-6- hydroxymethyldihydropteridine diphosphokinase n=1 Tax=Desulfoferrobacter suflitae TaxID=2865782 RepID=UPI002164A5E3|nr:2-amino-4-hydroxy-6-hydroxymethyldihydropteridine diphosphokinase [Desulfoferrobacter suflitae]MCK8601311.1 2-amino-4-hydroxy-6-hydroxymethyldihydropteridine diphosphokinase [Desulfoferrobacter suflitae]
MRVVFIGFGSNQGDSLRICREAVRRLGQNADIEIRRVSSFYRTEPVGFEDQPWFVNGVVQCVTDLEPQALWEVLAEIENHFGRIRAERWGPRTLDLDILAYGNEIIRLPDLTIPHPRMHERLFVLAPLQEIEPGWLHPVLHVGVVQLVERLGGSGKQVVRIEVQ